MCHFLHMILLQENNLKNLVRIYKEGMNHNESLHNRIRQYKLSDTPIEEVGANDVLISLKVAGLNRRDLSIANRMGNNKAPLVLGSDGAGVIESVGKNVSSLSVGDEVIINPSL